MLSLPGRRTASEEHYVHLPPDNGEVFELATRGSEGWRVHIPAGLGEGDGYPQRAISVDFSSFRIEQITAEV